jgi:oligopeptidase B
VKDKDVLAYLEAENAWFEAAMAPHKGLIDALFAEMKGRIKEDDSPCRRRMATGSTGASSRNRRAISQMVSQARGREGRGSADQLILDEPRWPRAMNISAWARCRSARMALLAYAVDDNGSERFEARIKDLETGEILPDVIPGTLSALVWTSRQQGAAL